MLYSKLFLVWIIILKNEDKCEKGSTLNQYFMKDPNSTERVNNDQFQINILFKGNYFHIVCLWSKIKKYIQYSRFHQLEDLIYVKWRENVVGIVVQTMELLLCLLNSSIKYTHTHTHTHTHTPVCRYIEEKTAIL